MKRNIYLALSALFLFIIVLSSCQNSTMTKEKEMKVDSMEKMTQHAMDSAMDANQKKIDAMPDSDIVNDSNAPGR